MSFLLAFVLTVVLVLTCIGFVTIFYAMLNVNLLNLIETVFSKTQSFITRTPNKDDIRKILCSIKHNPKNLEYLLMENDLSLNQIKTVLNYLQKEEIIKKYVSYSIDETVYGLKSHYLKQLKE